ncbi:helix-turn-helix transcriptional regulator [Georgenia sp. Z1491]|uniref:helix-turn-helix transcriptional regulator n=1 Tax=Georgenia sp. Z1491 TaxID=3416707 RepID=UPI003CFB4884
MTPPARTDPGAVSPVRERRKQHRLTQAELGALVGVSRHTVIAIEQGDYAPSVFLALRIARTLGSTVEDLFGAHPEAATDQLGETS